MADGGVGATGDCGVALRQVSGQLAEMAAQTRREGKRGEAEGSRGGSYDEVGRFCAGGGMGGREVGVPSAGHFHAGLGVVGGSRASGTWK